MTIGRSIPMNGMIRSDIPSPHRQNEFSAHKKRTRYTPRPLSLSYYPVSC
ncbi:Unknown protein sequence [Pseudomonas syringae pv. cerasicola]|uniref:Uncharacterized protein n=1 Tax=Pseudomonas syringae pv. cerasicola TaxID=264451 RepID=A0A0P9NXL4_PSESX|nr:Unknown protein sequence [Pseudomonas syringae pv. cerasicola]